MGNYNSYKKTALLFIAPQLLVTLVFFIWPALTAVLQSFFYSDAFGLHRRFASLSNYMDLWHQREYLHALYVTILMTVSVTVLTMSLGLVLALLVGSQKRGQSIYKTMLLWPYAVAPAIAAILWRFLFHPTLGFVTAWLHWAHVDFNYLIHPMQALLVIIIAASWQQFSYNFLFYFAALQLIPTSILEAAKMDGASAWHRFSQIIWPLLTPTTFFLLTMNILYCLFDTFGIIHVLTHGGPGYSTTTLIYKVYNDGFVGMDPGSSSAQSVILMVVVSGLALLQFRYLEKKVHYQ